MSSRPLRVVFEKWGGRPHWEFDTTCLGEDEHGVWLGVLAGTHQARPGVSVRAGSDHVLLVSASGDHCAGFHNDSGRSPVEVYVDVTCAHRWADERITMIDLDLDVIRHWNGSVIVDDEDEFEEHRVQLAYPDDVVGRALAATGALQNELRDRSAPFDGATSQQWLAVLTEHVSD